MKETTYTPNDTTVVFDYIYAADTKIFGNVLQDQQTLTMIIFDWLFILNLAQMIKFF